ncbi:hypothetical protein JCM6882_005446 [Rhodosporidiobolus microsporus]
MPNHNHAAAPIHRVDVTYVPSPPVQRYSAVSLVGGAHEHFQHIQENRTHPSLQFSPTHLALDGIGCPAAIAMHRVACNQPIAPEAHLLLFEGLWPAKKMASPSLPFSSSTFSDPPFLSSVQPIVMLGAEREGPQASPAAFLHFMKHVSTHRETNPPGLFFQGHRYGLTHPRPEPHSDWQHETAQYNWYMNRYPMSESTFRSLTVDLLLRPALGGAPSRIKIVKPIATLMYAMQDLLGVAKKLEGSPAHEPYLSECSEALLTLVSLRLLWSDPLVGRTVTPEQWDEMTLKLFPPVPPEAARGYYGFFGPDARDNADYFLRYELRNASAVAVEETFARILPEQQVQQIIEHVDITARAIITAILHLIERHHPLHPEHPNNAPAAHSLAKRSAAPSSASLHNPFQPVSRRAARTSAFS